MFACYDKNGCILIELCPSFMSCYSQIISLIIKVCKRQRQILWCGKLQIGICIMLPLLWTFHIFQTFHLVHAMLKNHVGNTQPQVHVNINWKMYSVSLERLCSESKTLSLVYSTQSKWCHSYLSCQPHTTSNKTFNIC